MAVGMQSQLLGRLRQGESRVQFWAVVCPAALGSVSVVWTSLNATAGCLRRERAGQFIVQLRTASPVFIPVMNILSGNEVFCELVLTIAHI